MSKNIIFNAKKDYDRSEYFKRATIILVVGFIAVFIQVVASKSKQIALGSSIVIIALLFYVSIIYIVCARIYRKISVDLERHLIEIEYITILSNKKIIIPINQFQSEMKNSGSFRAPQKKTLKLFLRKEKVAEIEMEPGDFSEDTIEMFLNTISNTKSL